MPDVPSIIPLSDTLPSYIDSDAPKRGFENVGDLMRPPLLYQIQATTKVKEKPEDEGHFWSEAHNGILKCPFYVVPIKYELEFMMFDDERQLMWRTNDPNDDMVRDLGNDAWRARWHHLLVKAPWASKDKPSMACMMSFKSVTEKIVRRWVTEMAQRPGDMFAQVYKVDMPKKKASNQKGSWWYPEISFAGMVDEASYRRLLVEYQGQWASQHVSGAREEDTSEGEDSGSNGPVSEDAPF